MSRHEIQAQITIHASPDHVFKLASDTARTKDWLPNITSAKNHGTKKGVGAERDVQLKFHNYEIQSRQRITDHEPGKKFGWLHIEDKVDGEPFDLLDDIGTVLNFEPSGKKTQVHAVAHFKPRGLKARLAVPFIQKDIEKQMQIALENLKRICEAK
jgi:uncharacterized protein YndB with AHSA1/START domain